ncbi:MAG: hypothetical protein AAF633_27640 [Chloroflexota bacterium]
MIDIDSGEIITVSGEGLNAFFPSWSADGEWIFYHAQSSGNNRDIYMSRIDQSETIRLTETEEQERMFSLGQ